MMQVRLIDGANIKLLERNVNAFLMELGSEPGVSIRLEDIKLVRSAGEQMVAMVIYNKIRQQMPPSQQPQKG